MSNKDLIIPNGKILDFLDEVLRKDTPEEYVRQQIEKSLVLEYSYPKEFCASEKTIKMGSSKKSVDICIYDGEKKGANQENIRIIVECKEEKIPSSHKTEGINQLKSYMSACLNCEFGLWTNSKERIVIRKTINKDKKKFNFDEIIDIPKFNEPLEKTEKPDFKDLRKGSGDNLKFSFRRCHDYIAGNQGLQKPEAFWELLKIIFCKISDEKSSDLNFYVTSDDRKSLNGQLKLRNRIDTIFKSVISEPANKNIFKENDKIELEPRITAFIVSQIQNYSLLESEIDVKGAAYEEIVGSNLRGDRGEFFTPRNVCKMVVEMINPKSNEKVLDPSCGTGGFLTIAMNHALDKISKKIQNKWRDKDNPTDNERRLLFEEIKKYTEHQIYGLDLNPNLVKACKMNMVLNNDGSGSLFQNNSLEHFHKFREDFKKKLGIKNDGNIGKFDVVLANPPFGEKIVIDDPNILSLYDLGYIWKKEKDNTFTKTEKLHKSVAPEILFIERCIEFLKPGGRIGIVLPDAILGAPGLQYVRSWIINHTQVIASVDLHKDTFQPKNGTQTSVLILRKKNSNEIVNNKTPIFFCIVDKIGHDKRGNIIYKTDPEGNEILVNKTEKTFVSEKGKKVPKYINTKSKVIDDNTSNFVNLFKEWKEENGKKFEVLKF